MLHNGINIIKKNSIEGVSIPEITLIQRGYSVLNASFRSWLTNALWECSYKGTKEYEYDERGVVNNRLYLCGDSISECVNARFGAFDYDISSR